MMLGPIEVPGTRETLALDHQLVNFAAGIMGVDAL
jgi:hypothetical protein